MRGLAVEAAQDDAVDQVAVAVEEGRAELQHEELEALQRHDGHLPVARLEDGRDEPDEGRDGLLVPDAGVGLLLVDDGLQGLVDALHHVSAVLVLEDVHHDLLSLPSGSGRGPSAPARLGRRRTK